MATGGEPSHPTSDETEGTITLGGLWELKDLRPGDIFARRIRPPRGTVIAHHYAVVQKVNWGDSGLEGNACIDVIHRVPSRDGGKIVQGNIVCSSRDRPSKLVGGVGEVDIAQHVRVNTLHQAMDALGKHGRDEVCCRSDSCFILWCTFGIKDPPANLMVPLEKQHQREGHDDFDDDDKYNFKYDYVYELNAALPGINVNF